MITRDNYEAYFLDYLEGRLAPSQAAELRAFLDENPDLRHELEEFKPFALEPPADAYPLKGSLKKDETEVLKDPERQFEEFSVAWHENDLDQEMKKRLEAYMKVNPDRQKDFSLFGKVYLRPDPAVFFPRKSALKHFAIPAVYYRRMVPFAVAAASVALLVLSWLWLLSEKNLPDVQLSQADTAVASPSLPAKPSATVTHGPPGQEMNIAPVRQEEKITVPVKKATQPVIQIKLSRQPEITILPSPAALTEIPRMETTGISARTVTAELKEAGLYRMKTEAENVMNLQELAYYQLKKSVLREDPENMQPGRPTIWDLADAGIRGLNRFTGWEMKLQKEYDEEGKIDILAFDSRILQLTHRPGR